MESSFGYALGCWVGIDPGATGAIAVIGDNERVTILDYPGDERETVRALKLLPVIPDAVTLEGQNAFPGQGVTSMFHLGVNYGIWLAAIAAMEWPMAIVRPADWKKGMGYPSKNPGENAAKFKTRSKEHSLTLARRLYPKAAGLLTRKKDHNRAEALLIAHYGRMKSLGKEELC